MLVQVEGVGNGEAVRVGGRGVWETSVPPAQFCCESKTALKNKVYFKK